MWGCKDHSSFFKKALSLSEEIGKYVLSKQPDKCYSAGVFSVLWGTDYLEEFSLGENLTLSSL